MEYFESILENFAAFDEMDVYGHIDYVVRYGPNQNREYSYGRYKDILDEILRTLISREKGNRAEYRRLSLRAWRTQSMSCSNPALSRTWR